MSELFYKHHGKIYNEILAALVDPHLHVIQIYGWCNVGKTELLHLAQRDKKQPQSLKYQNYTCSQGDEIKLDPSLLSINDQVFIFDDAHNLSDSSKKRIFEFIGHAQDSRQNIKCVLIYQGFNFTQLLRSEGIDCKVFEILPLDKSKSKELFESKLLSPSINCSQEAIDSVIYKSCGFPTLLINLATNLSSFSNPLFVQDFLQQFDIPNEFFKCFEDIMARTPYYLQCMLTWLSALPIQFDYHALKDIVEQGSKMLDYLCQQRSKTSDYLCQQRSKTSDYLCRIKNSGLLTENENETFSLLYIVRYFFCNEKIKRSLVGKIPTFLSKVYSDFKTGQLQLPKNMLQNHVENTFHRLNHFQTFEDLYQVAEMISQAIGFYPREATEFYRMCYDESCYSGSQSQKVSIQLWMGKSIITSSANSNLDEGAEHCKNALETFKVTGRKLKCVVAYNALALCCYWQGKHEEADGYCEEANTLITEADKDDEIMYYLFFIKNIESYNSICLGKTDRGLAIAKSLFENRKFSNHPTCGVVASTLGWIKYQQRNLKKALEYYTLSLKKLKEIKIANQRLIVPMCYIADIESDLRKHHEGSLKNLEVTEKIQREFCIGHINYARIFLVKGKIYIRMGDMKRSFKNLEFAAKIMTETNSKHYITIEIDLWLAHCYLIKVDEQTAKNKFHEINKTLDGALIPQSRYDYKTSVKGHIKAFDDSVVSHFTIDGCKICEEINSHNRENRTSTVMEFRNQPVESDLYEENQHALTPCHCKEVV